ncbi:hypothetical protein [Pedobacter sp.]
MKNLLLFLFLLAPLAKKEHKYIIKQHSLSCGLIDGKPLSGYKIALLPISKDKKNVGLLLCQYQYDKTFSEYSNDEKIEILEELLSFEGDTSICAKEVCNYGSKFYKRPLTKFYTTQIDALYLFTVLTVASYSPNYCPFPVLYDNQTGEEINNDQKKISKIFEIYRKWLKENKSKGFVNYNVPLRDKRFEWFSTQKNFNYYKDEFKIAKLDRAARVVGICKD